MNIAAPVSMLAGKGSGPALLVIGLIVAAWLAQQAKTQQPPTRRPEATMPDAKSSDPAHIICCAAGMPDAPGNYPKGRYLAWVHGWFVPCCQPAVATR